MRSIGAQHGVRIVEIVEQPLEHPDQLSFRMNRSRELASESLRASPINRLLVQVHISLADAAQCRIRVALVGRRAVACSGFWRRNVTAATRQCDKGQRTKLPGSNEHTPSKHESSEPGRQ